MYKGAVACTIITHYRAVLPARLWASWKHCAVGGVHIGGVRNAGKDLAVWFDKLSLSGYDQQVAKGIDREIHHRLKTLKDVGLGYLTLNRLANSLVAVKASVSS